MSLLESIEDEITYKCDLCRELFNSADDAGNHKKKAHSESNEENRDDLFRILQIIYELSHGRNDNGVTIVQIHKKIDTYGTDLIRSLITYWADRKFVKANGTPDRARKFFMCPKGIEYVEKELKK